MLLLLAQLHRVRRIVDLKCEFEHLTVGDSAARDQKSVRIMIIIFKHISDPEGPRALQRQKHRSAKNASSAERALLRLLLLLRVNAGGLL
jgi:hypothetical protein